MKPWQHSVELSTLKDIEQFYAPYNKFALSPFAKFKKNNIAEFLHKGVLKNLNGAYLVEEQVKVSSKITMLPKVVIGEKLKGDVTLSRLCGDSLVLLDALDLLEDKNCWLICFAGDKQIRKIAERCNFRYVGYKVSSFAEVFSVYFRDAEMNFARREHPHVRLSEYVGMAKLCDVNVSRIEEILHQLNNLKRPVDFSNHYSNYNKKGAWSAFSLRGYSSDPLFIAKPAEMNAKWKAENKDTHYELQDTPLYKYFTEVRELLSFLDGEVHRVRFMRLAPGGGELERHTDQVDPDAGNSLGALARLHFPLKTNKDVLFSTWDQNDEQKNYHFRFGECWVIDTRKPHKAINGGTEERIHLVVDTIVTPKLENLIINSQSPEVL
jgi:hypothetical protein